MLELLLTLTMFSNMLVGHLRYAYLRKLSIVRKGPFVIKKLVLHLFFSFYVCHLHPLALFVINRVVHNVLDLWTLLHWSVRYHSCCTTAAKGAVVAFAGCAHDGVGVDITIELRVTTAGGVMRGGRQRGGRGNVVVWLVKS